MSNINYIISFSVLLFLLSTDISHDLKSNEKIIEDNLKIDNTETIESVQDVKCVIELDVDLLSGGGNLSCNQLSSCCGTANCGGAGTVEACVITCSGGGEVFCDIGNACEKPIED